MVRRFCSKISRSTTMHGVGRSSFDKFLKSRRAMRPSISSYRVGRATEREVATKPLAAAVARKRLREVIKYILHPRGRAGKRRRGKSLGVVMAAGRHAPGGIREKRTQC